MFKKLETKADAKFYAFEVTMAVVPFFVSISALVINWHLAKNYRRNTPLFSVPEKTAIIASDLVKLVGLLTVSLDYGLHPDQSLQILFTKVFLSSFLLLAQSLTVKNAVINRVS